MCRPDVNFVVVDTSSYLDMLYMWSVQNTNIIGDYISLGLKQLTDANPSAEIHLIGHSLGAHIMAFAARQYQNLTGRLVDRVTGLDPAKPCFKAQSRSDGKASDIARFVDVIHTNAGLLGEDSPVAHADFYPGGDDPIQNGCIFFECSHSRAIEYFAESVYPGQEQNFLASKCSSMENMRAKACSSSHSVMGYEVDKNATGSSTLFMGGVPPQIQPDITKMHFQYMTPCLNYSVPLLKAEKLWNHPQFRRNRKLVILATGWTNTVNASATISMISRAFMCRPRVNFVIVDAAYYVDTLYKWSALNTDLIGEHLAVGLHHLIKVSPLIDIHLIALDPAKPCFRNEKSLPGLMRGDAELVDVIHTNNGILAKRDPIGDIDFYPGGVHPIKPGCLTIGCSHTRAVEYFAESVYPQQERSFVGIRCSSWKMLEWHRCESDITSTMGYLINRKANGIFYVDVNGRSPFGKNYNVPRQGIAECAKPSCISKFLSKLQKS
ncbi:hypothetical protein AWZ03_001042 [Drosophila navojoa]|uniref:Lipase domain-containing protein n=1 Tax=Drosophila navojoa TaxID=7232 RepID=A0A484BVF2_DRONA|nr:hypothetical protein AWZ03_001042 [Drosophila navojoa]